MCVCLERRILHSGKLRPLPKSYNFKLPRLTGLGGNKESYTKHETFPGETTKHGPLVHELPSGLRPKRGYDQTKTTILRFYVHTFTWLFSLETAMQPPS